ncbi:MAG: hypothetical protein P8Z71_13070 [Candidatus Sulfobium sp.]|jgi:CubicO group peptidase (beta-lactamase class C family)
MSEKEKPLPRPPGKKFHEGEDNTPILADRIAEALAGGKLDEFMKREIPDSEQARTLVSMMMGMTGMLPPEGLKNAGGEESSGASAEETSGEAPSAAEPPEDVREAAQTGDMDMLIGLLKREHGKRRDGAADSGLEGPAGDGATIGREDIDRLLRIASDNGLSPDWIILRAIKLYIREYGKTGRL